MTIERLVRIMAGSFVLFSLALGLEESPIFVSRWFLAFTAFVGFNLLQSGFTGFCPPEKLLAKLGAKHGIGGNCFNRSRMAIFRNFRSGKSSIRPNGKIDAGASKSRHRRNIP